MWVTSCRPHMHLLWATAQVVVDGGGHQHRGATLGPPAAGGQHSMPPAPAPAPARHMALSPLQSGSRNPSAALSRAALASPGQPATGALGVPSSIPATWGDGGGGSNPYGNGSGEGAAAAAAAGRSVALEGTVTGGPGHTGVALGVVSAGPFLTQTSAMLTTSMHSGVHASPAAARAGPAPPSGTGPSLAPQPDGPSAGDPAILSQVRCLQHSRSWSCGSVPQDVAWPWASIGDSPCPLPYGAVLGPTQYLSIGLGRVARKQLTQPAAPVP